MTLKITLNILSRPFENVKPFFFVLFFQYLIKVCKFL